MSMFVRVMGSPTRKDARGKFLENEGMVNKMLGNEIYKVMPGACAALEVLRKLAKGFVKDSSCSLAAPVSKDLCERATTVRQLGLECVLH
jgi:hypothetical protein